MARKSSSPGLPSQRQLRAGELVRHAVSDILAREDFRDPDLKGIIVTVGEVRCSPDLRHANIFVSPLGDDSEAGRAKLADAVAEHMGPPLPLVGAGELVSNAAKTLRDCDAVMVVEDGKPVGVLTRHDLLGFLSDGNVRR